MPNLTFTDLVKDTPAGRFDGIKRPYSPEDVLRLSGSFQVRHSLAERGANGLWQLLHSDPSLPSLGAMTGNQAVQMVRAGLKAIYLSGWQVAADSNTAGATYPDQSLYPAGSGPGICPRIKQGVLRGGPDERLGGRAHAGRPRPGG